ncbi:hypothetical protein ES708_04959 [subsurface metagenome]
MKGRNCYARFCRHPGLEKLFTFIDGKASFLRPVSLPTSQREPFMHRIATGTNPRVHHVGSFLLVIRLSFNAGRYFFLYSFLVLQWPVPVLQLDGNPSYSVRPLIFSWHTSLCGAAGSYRGLRITRPYPMPAAFFFSAVNFLHGGRLRLQCAHAKACSRTVRFKEIP